MVIMNDCWYDSDCITLYYKNTIYIIQEIVLNDM